METASATPELTRKMDFKGKIIKTTLAGAIVDFGNAKLGVVHIAHLRKEAVKRVEDVVKIGDEVQVWIHRIKEDANHVELTMIEPLALEWREIRKGMEVSGTVTRLEKFGAFVDIGAERPGLAHISELSHDYVRNPGDAVKVGEEVKVLVLDFSRRKKQIKLSIKALLEKPEPDVVDVEVDESVASEPVLTAMEMAFLKAKKGSDTGSTTKQASKKVKDSSSKTQREIALRTLANKEKAS
jgi:small subunit ribosomal protein S1